MKRILIILIFALPVFAATKKKPATVMQSPLDRYIVDAQARSLEAVPSAPGSIWRPGSRLADAARDLRASQVDDMLTIQVVENASAVAKGATKTARSSSASATVTSLAGAIKTTSALSNLAGMSGDRQLAGEGTTSRDVVISTTLTARVAAVMPNGVLIVEAAKDVEVNSERQTITVRGIVRPADIGADNVVRSDRLGQLEVRVNGKGVVGDAIKRPFFLYRLLLGLLPF